MSESDDAAARLDRLEMRVTEQEAVIDDLNAALTAQWRTIDALTRRLERLADEFEAASRGQPGAPEPPPPHY